MCPGPVAKLAQPELIWCNLWRQKQLSASAAFDWTTTSQTSPTRPAAALTASLSGANRDAHAPPHPLRRTFSCIPCPPPRSQEIVKKLSGPPDDREFRSLAAGPSGGALLVRQGRERRWGRGAVLEGYAAGLARVHASLRASDGVVCARVAGPFSRSSSSLPTILGSSLA